MTIEGGGMAKERESGGRGGQRAVSEIMIWVNVSE